MTNFALEDIEIAFPEFNVEPNYPRPGGQKSVFFGTRAGEPVALKILNIPLSEGSDVESALSENFPERVRREILALRNIDSPYIAKILEGPDNRLIGGGKYLWYMEPRYGIDLHRRLELDGPLDPARWINLVESLLLAERELCESGLVHRDIKPLNVLESNRDERFVLIDLGVALHIDLPRLTELTPTRTTIYAAPEQLDSPPRVDHRTDIFQIGLTAYIAATNFHPFVDEQGVTLDQLQERIAAGPDVQKLSEAGLAKETIAFVRKCLGARPNRRFRTVDMALDSFYQATNR